MTGALEIWMLVLFAGGPGLAALIVQAWRHHTEAPMREASAAQVLIDTGDQLMNRMQNRIDQLDAELRKAENEIHELRGRLDEAIKHSEDLGRMQERVRQAETENERLRGQLPERDND